MCVSLMVSGPSNAVTWKQGNKLRQTWTSSWRAGELGHYSLPHSTFLAESTTLASSSVQHGTQGTSRLRQVGTARLSPLDGVASSFLRVIQVSMFGRRILTQAQSSPSIRSPLPRTEQRKTTRTKRRNSIEIATATLSVSG